MRALVSGGAGFIGHHLVRGLLERGDQVTVIDDFSTGLRSRLDSFRGEITLVEGSILDSVALDRAAANSDVIFHEAAIASVAQSIVTPRRTNETNVTGTIEVMLAGARHKVRRVVFASSSAVYGIPERLPCREDQRPEPMSPYGVSKLAGEHYVHTLGHLHGVETVVLRYFNVFGPGQDPASEYAAVIPKFGTAVLQGEAPTIYGTGEISRDFIYVDDVVAANLLAAMPTSPSGLTCNVATGSHHTLTQLLQSICTAVGREVEPILGPPRVGDIIDSRADIAAARQALDFSVSVSFDEGIARTMDWLRRALQV
jgi:nucleoside-diphosphate-sugar epimerase